MSKSTWLKDEDQKGNFSNQKQDTFDPGKGYVGIRLQQGSPLLDRDWNELEDIRRYAEVMLRKYFIGNGVHDENGFKITAVDTPANDFRVFAGRCLVEGFEVVNEPVDPDGNPLDFILYSRQGGVEPLNVPDVDRSDTVYLDVWIEEVTGQEEAALNNPQDVNVETCTRHKLNWRVKVNEGSEELPGEAFHHYYAVARLSRKPGKETIEAADIMDLRRTGLALYLIKAGLDLLTGQSNADAQHTHSQLVSPGGTSVPALQVDKNGKVGIGITDPDPDIRLAVGGILSPAIKMTGTDGSTGFIQTLYEHRGVRLYDGKDYAMHWKNGKVGIGTNNPDATLHVRGIALFEGGNGTFSLYGGVDPVEYNGFLQLLNSVRSANAWGLKAGGVLVSDDYSYANPGKNDLIVKGNVGIGNTKPWCKLDINGGSNYPINAVTSQRYIMRMSHVDDIGGGWLLVNEPNKFFAICENSGGDRLIIKDGGHVGIGTTEPGAKLDVAGNISGMSYRNVTESFFVGGDGDKFYAVAFRDDDWGQGPAEFEIIRSNVHENRDMWGAMNLRINWHASNWGHGAGYIARTYNYSIRTFVKDIKEYPYNPYLLVWLRGNTTYYYRSLNNRVVLHQILGTNNQSCSFDPVGYQVYSTAIDCTFRPEGCIQAGTTISGDFYIDGRSHAARRTGAGIDYAEYFESKDGKEINAGISVALDNGKIRPVKKNETPLGVISANPGIVGGVHIEWPKKHLRDEFGRVIMEEYKEEIMKPKKEKVKKERQKMEKKTVKEEVTRTEIVKIKGKYCQKEITDTIEREIEEPIFNEVDLYDAAGKNKIGKHKIPVMETYEEEIDVLDEKGQPVMVGTGKFEIRTRPKINPEYDETKEYIPREKRPEWNCVGLLGQLPLRKGQSAAPTWIKIKDISKDVELWLVK